MKAKISALWSKLGVEDSWGINRHSDRRLMPFELKFRLPKLRKDRIIFDRDEFGKIVSSRVPKMRLFR